jgi:hypothetical protein
VIVELSHRSHGRARGAHRVRLVDGDGRRNSRDRLDLRLVHAVEELPRVGGEGLDVTPLAFRIQRVENERRLAGTRYARDDDQLVERQIEIEPLQVVLARATHEDGVTGGVGHCVSGGFRSRRNSPATGRRKHSRFYWIRLWADHPTGALGRRRAARGRGLGQVPASAVRL